MAKKYLIILFAIFIFGCADGTYVDIYYDGFWTKHRVYQSEQGLVDDASIMMLKVKLSDLPIKSKELMFDGYSTIEGATIPQDIVFMLVVTDKKGQTIKKVIGDSMYLYDPLRDEFKQLNDKEKNYLRCLFYEISTEHVVPAKLAGHCRTQE